MRRKEQEKDPAALEGLLKVLLEIPDPRDREYIAVLTSAYIQGIVAGGKLFPDRREAVT